MLGKLQGLVDDHIHLQQAAGTTKVGYNAYYDHKLAQQLGLANYSGTRANKEFWAHDQNDTEKEILRIKAHVKQLSTVSQNKGRQGSAAGNNDGDGNPMAKSSRSRHNKRQCKMYNKRKEAKKAQQAKKTAANKASAAAATPVKAGQ